MIQKDEGKTMYFIIFVLILACFVFSILRSRYKTTFSVLRLLILLFYSMSVLSFIWYLIKDLTRLGDFLNYFIFSRRMITSLYSIPISKDAIIVLLNFSCLAFLYTNLILTCQQPDFIPKRGGKRLLLLSGLVSGFLFVAYAPAFYSFLHSVFSHNDAALSRIETFYEILEGFTNLYTVFVLVLSLASSIHTIRTEAESRFFFRNVLLVGISFDALLISYFFLLNNLPQLLVRYSDYTQSVIHTSLSSGNVMLYYKYFQYLLPAIVLIFSVSFIIYGRRLYQLNNHSLKISRSIESANISSRIFCHFMKNEIIALSAEVENLPTTPEGEKEVEEILKHCEYLYQRMDAVHKSMKDNVMDMQTYELIPILQKIIASVEVSGKARMKEQNISILTQFPDQPIYVLVDETYLEQSILNLIKNSMDAFEQTPRGEHIIMLSVNQNPRWTNIEVRDNGCGISEADLPNIFVPLFTTKPTTKNWGLGLSLTYRTISSFHGRIRVKSTSPRGTVFEISLPLVRTKSQKTVEVAHHDHRFTGRGHLSYFKKIYKHL